MHEQDYHLISREITLIQAIYRIFMIRIPVKYICTSPAADCAVTRPRRALLLDDMARIFGGRQLSWRQTWGPAGRLNLTKVPTQQQQKTICTSQTQYICLNHRN